MQLSKQQTNKKITRTIYQSQCSTTSLWKIRIPSAIFFCLSLTICVYMATARIVHYISAPISADSSIIQDEGVKFPPVILCRYAYEDLSFAPMFTDLVRKKCSEFENCRDLTESKKDEFLLSDLNVDLNDFWDEQGILPELVDPMVYCPYLKNQNNCEGRNATNVSKKRVRTIMGTCVEVFLDDEFEFHGYYSYFTLNIKPHKKLHVAEITEKTPDVWLYIPHSKQYSDHEIFYDVRVIPKFCQVEIELSTQRFQFLNRPSQPCRSENEVFDCINKCVRRDFVKTLSCSLPFFTIHDRPMCNTLNATVNAYVSAYKMYDTMTLSRCKCTRPCEDTVLNTVAKMEQPEIYESNKYSTSVSLRYANSLKTITTETYKYSFEALVSDIGGNIGFFLGVSVLSAFNVITEIYNKIKQKCSKSKRIEVRKVRHVKLIKQRNLNSEN